MNHYRLLLIAVLLSTTVLAQETKYYSDPDIKFKQAKEFYQKEQYSLAYPLLRELMRDVKETDKINSPITVQEIEYYTIVCGLKQNEERAEELAQDYINLQKNNARVQMMNFQLAEYYFRSQKFRDALQQYDQTNIANLSNREIADMKFHQGYSYFILQDFAKAKPLFNTIRTLKNDPNYIDANYYYGFLAFRDKQYKEALESFKIVENDKNYANVVPFYIAQIYYIQGKKDESINYIQKKLQSGASSQYYDLELKQLIGHAYFEKGEFAKALPYLEDYVSRSQKVRREDLYELSYSYYMANNYSKAIDGFKQLSGKQDSLSQHAMYLLGDAYLKTGQKANARNAFLFCASNSSNAEQKEIARYQYAKLSYELGFQDEALNSLSSFIADYPNSKYIAEAKDLMVAILAGTNNFKDALTMIEGLKNPSDYSKKIYPRILYGRAAELINDGRLSEADALLNKLLGDPNNRSVLPFAQFWKGEIAYRNKQLDSAIKYYQQYVSSGSPTLGEANATNARYNLGYCYLRKENYPVALSYFEPLGKNPALNSDALTQDAYIRTADCYYMQKNYAVAKSMYDNVVKFSWPAEDYATFQIAMLAGVKDPNQKIALMNNLIRKFPNSSLASDANMEIANTFMSNEKFRDAIPYLNNVLQSTTSTTTKAQIKLKLGTAYYNIDDNNNALKQFKEIVAQYPNAPEAEDALDNVKTIYIEEGKPDEYSAYMRQIGKPLSANVEDDLTYNAAEKLYDGQKINEALSAFKAYLQQFPNGTHALEATFNVAEIYNSRKDWDNALPAYEYVVSKSPNQYAEIALLNAGRISFFEQKNYQNAERYYTQLKQLTASQENKLEAMRGILRSQYQLGKYADAVDNAKELTNAKGSNADDKALANMAMGKANEANGQLEASLNNYKQVIQLNKAGLAAEARYETAHCLFLLNRLKDAEKAAMETINKSGSYDYWITKAYILIGEIYFKQKDYFNAKATLQSVVNNTLNQELKTEAQTKLNEVIAEEGKSSKVNN